MIAKISATRSGSPGGFVSYLFGPGKKNEHLDPHTVGGSVHYPGAGTEVRGQVIADLQLPKTLWPKVEFPGGHIWHVALSIDSSEGRLPDAKWERIAHDYMHEMKLDDPAKAPLRWTAVHHGASAEGHDHIHIVANLIREDGTKASIWKDQVRSQAIIANLEQVHGLKVLQARHAKVGAGSVPYTDKEAGKAFRTERPIERVELERKVRAAATTAQTEADFVKLLRADRVAVRPYPKSGAVTGYSAALLSPTNEPGRPFAGGELARDLTLPRLRGSWPDAGGSRAAAEAEWRRGGSPVKSPPVKVLVGAAEVEQAVRVLHALETDLHLAGPAEFAELSQDLAGVTAAAAKVAPVKQRVELAKASREIGGWAGTRQPVKRLRTSRTQRVAMLLLHATNMESEQSQAFMRRQLIEGLLKVLRVHRAVRPMPVVTHGRGAVMSQANDDVDGAMSDALTTGAVTALAVAGMNAEEKRAKQLAAAQRVTGGFFGRFSRKDPEPLKARLPVPAGFRESFDDQGWAALSSEQRLGLDPDRIGRWVTDVDPRRLETGPELRSTSMQIMLVNDMGTALGEAGHSAAVGDVNRAQAAALIRKLEDRLEPDVARRIYHELGMPYRSEKDGKVTFQFEGDPAPVVAQAGNQPSADPAKQVTPRVAAPKQARPSKLDDPLQWKTATEPVTPAQTGALARHGIPANEIRQINKGWAGVVLSSFDKDGDIEGHATMDKALAAVENAAQSVNTPKPQTQQTKNQGPRTV